MVGSLFFLYFCTAFELPLGKENKKHFILYSAHLILSLTSSKILPLGNKKKNEFSFCIPLT